ncbi:MAG TPA: metallophosphoesterase [Methanospirillum sp.]|nr:metallophosphoesterase [Methanospirillum sp.]
MIDDEHRLLVIADIHMGIESDLRLHGIHLQSRGQERISRVVHLVKDTAPDMIILLGDVKHRVPGTSWQEFRELPELFSSLRKLTSLRISPGNHDPGIEDFLQEEELLKKEGDVIDEIGFMHGHTKPHPSLAGRLIIAGHHHPVISLPDEVGIALRAPCYVLAELDSMIFDTHPVQEQSTRVLLVPAFNELSGYGIEKTFRTPFSPLSRSINTQTAECLLTDGTYGGDLLSLIRHDNNSCT